MNGYEKSRNTVKRSAFDFSQVHIEQLFFGYLLLFDSFSMVYEGICGEISIFFDWTDN